ncbi:MAG: type IV pilus modification protein PilV [Gammaproteobacteria bacterium]|nr:type IV pilus modification protein PilV [Gammaproteobacteria bacterium]
MKTKPYQVLRKLRGFTMVEILVTIIILSIGLLGVAALQVTGMRSVNSASHRTHAAILVDDIAERMRANPPAVNSNSFMGVDSAANINCAVVPVTYCEEAFNGAVIAAANCNSTELATFDIKTWFCGVSSAGILTGGVQAALPQAIATITCIDTDPPGGVADADPCTNNSPHIISLSWGELNPNRTSANATTTQTLAVTIQP